MKFKKTASFVLHCLIVFPAVGFASEAADVITKIFEQKSDAVVLIAVASSEGDKIGSGFFISRDGKLVTNYHLIKGANKVLVKMKNGIAFVPTAVINLDPAKDIAIIKIDRATPKYFAMGNSNSVNIGQRVCSIGNPQGLESTVADGLISSIRVDGLGMKVFQISVPLSQGSSGGPLIDLNGEVVGITTASLTSGENLNFAVPINYVRILLKKPFDSSRVRPEPWQIRQRQPVPIIYQPVWDNQYLVQKGDSLYKIARKFKTKVKTLIEINHLKGQKILPGQILKIPKANHVP